MQKRYKRYNIDNLTPFTTDNASYYGSIGGYASGKSKLYNKIHTTRLQMAMIQLELEPYRTRKRIYNRELDIIKQQIHNYKILNNRYNKLIDKYNQKYGVIAWENNRYF